MKLTDEEKKEYLVQPNRCPKSKCKSNKIKTETMMQDSKGAWQWITCESCNFIWRDEYKLVGITEEVEDKQSMATKKEMHLKRIAQIISKGNCTGIHCTGYWGCPLTTRENPCPKGFHAKYDSRLIKRAYTWIECNNISRADLFEYMF